MRTLCAFLLLVSLMLPIASFAGVGDMVFKTWTLVYEVDANGAVVAGSYNDLKIAFDDGADIKVIVNNSEMLSNFEICNAGGIKAFCVKEFPYTEYGEFTTNDTTKVVLVDTNGKYDSRWFSRDGSRNYQDDNTLPSKWFVQK